MDVISYRHTCNHNYHINIIIIVMKIVISHTTNVDTHLNDIKKSLI